MTVKTATGMPKATMKMTLTPRQQYDGAEGTATSPP
jgi:hypothetical protein